MPRLPATPDHLPNRGADGQPPPARRAAAPAPRHDAADARPLPRLRRARRTPTTGTRRRARSSSTRARATSRRCASSPPREAPTLRAFCDVVLAQDAEPRIPVARDGRREARRRPARRLPLRRHARRPRDLAAGAARPRRAPPSAARRDGFAAAEPRDAAGDRRALRRGRARRRRWDELDVARAWSVVHARRCSRPSTPTRGRGTRSASAARPTRAATCASGRRHARAAARRRGGVRRRPGRDVDERGRRERRAARLAQGRASARATTTRATCSTSTAASCPARDAMRRYRRRRRGRPGDRRRGRGRRRCSPSGSPASGWRIVILEAGPFWDPDEDWVSDEAGSHQLYWTAEADHRRRRPDRARQEQLRPRRRRLDGPLRRLHAALSPLRLRDPHAATASAPTGRSPTRTSSRTTSSVERELPVAGQDWPWGDPHRYPYAPHPISRRRRARAGEGARDAGHRDARRPGRHRQRHLRQPPALHLPRLLPAGLQGQRQGQPARHPPARRARARRRDPRRRAWPSASRSTSDRPLHAASPTSRRRARERFQRAAAVAVAGYSIETPAAAAELHQRAASRTASATTTTRSAAT